MSTNFKEALKHAVTAYENRHEKQPGCCSASFDGPSDVQSSMPTHRYYDVLHIKDEIARTKQDVILRRHLIEYIDLHMQSGFTLFGYQLRKSAGHLIQGLYEVLNRSEFSEDELLRAAKIRGDESLSASDRMKTATGEQLKEIIIEDLHSEINTLEVKLAAERRKSNRLFRQVQKLSRERGLNQGQGDSEQRAKPRAYANGKRNPTFYSVPNAHLYTKDEPDELDFPPANPRASVKVSN